MPAANPERSVFEITRHFPRPLAQVWQAWSDAALLAQWWGPKGCRIEVARLEFRPGGFFHYAMHFDGAPTTWGRFAYREIVANERLVWLNAFANERCGIVRAPFSDECPLEIENTVQFRTQGDGTTVHLRAAPFGETEAEQRYFQSIGPSLDEGYGGTLDQLEALLKKA